MYLPRMYTYRVIKKKKKEEFKKFERFYITEFLLSPIIKNSMIFFFFIIHLDYIKKKS